MDPVEPGAGGAEAYTTYEEIAHKIDYQILAPAVTDDDLHRACLVARSCQVAAIVVRPSDVDAVLRSLEHSTVRVGSVAGYPHGSTTTAAKLYEARDLLRRGVKQIDVVPNIGKLISRQFQYAEMELVQISQDCREAGATMKVVVDSELLGEEMKIIACRMTKRVKAEFAAATEARDVELMLKHCGFRAAVQVGGVTDLDRALALLGQGVAHLGSTDPEPLLEAWTARLAARARAS